MITMAKSYLSTEVCKMTGVKYRILDHWIRVGVLRPEVREGSGPGSRREWSAEQVEQIDAMWQVHEYLADYVGSAGVSTEAMHSLALALRERRPWRMGVAVNEEGIVEMAGQW